MMKTVFLSALTTVASISVATAGTLKLGIEGLTEDQAKIEIAFSEQSFNGNATIVFPYQLEPQIDLDFSFGEGNAPIFSGTISYNAETKGYSYGFKARLSW